MKPKQPRDILARWAKGEEPQPEYVGEWHVFVWPAKALKLPSYVTMWRTYKIGRSIQFLWACTCAGYQFTDEDTVNGEECTHIRQLKEQVDDLRAS